MVNEQDKTIQALQIAIQMEVDGKEYYLKASQESSNELGRKLLRSLAAEEDVHRQKFEEIYNAITGKRGWPSAVFQPDGGKNLRTIFARATEEIGSNVKGIATELNAVQTAIDMEMKSHDLYKGYARSAVHDAEREFYTVLAAEEKEHQLILLDYYEYLNDPAAWFVAKEHPSLDGG